MNPITRAAWLVAGGLLTCVMSLAATASPISVTTYHYDNLRTGWNKEETILSASAFPKSFGVLATVAVDDQVDAQPLLVYGETIAGGVHNVLYVVTEHNSVYALDADTGQVLVQANLGTPVPRPLNCPNNGADVGITSTPVIDLGRHQMYVMAYTNASGSPQYQLHDLNLLTLADAAPPVTVAASHTLTDGSKFAFNATYQRQRPALLEFYGNIYAGFGSFCDFSASHSRGWVLGWTGSLTPLGANELNDTQATSPTSFFLSSVWMSGFGLASNGSTLFFSTGNSDCNFYDSPKLCPAQTTYDGVTNIQESVVSLAPNLATRTGLFTPSNVFQMDIDDADLGASGVMLLPRFPNGAELATIVSKDGRLWLLNQASLGTALDMHQLPDGCWCGTSYYSEFGIARVVSSAGSLQTWQVATTPAPHLVAESTTSTIPHTEQDPGFFTVVSSNAHQAGSAIIWAVGRPTGSPATLTLYAFSATPASGTLPLLYSGAAGSWPNTGGNANIVPLVANGKVYVGAYKTVTIFGPNGTPAAASSAAAPSEKVAAEVTRVTGTLVSVQGSQMTLLTRAGKKVQVDAAPARAAERAPSLVLGQPYTVIAPRQDSATPLEATSITRAKPGQGAWPTDE